MGQMVLFVNDEPKITNVFKQAFQNEPFSLETAASVKDAMNLLDNEPFDVIVSDENLDAMPGIEFLSVARLKFPDIVRIVLTSRAGLKSSMRAVNNGEIFRFLVKPCNKTDLAATVRQAIVQKNLIEDNRLLMEISRKQLEIIKQIAQETEGITELDRSNTGSIILSDPAKLSIKADDFSQKLSLVEKRMAKQV